MSRFLEYLIESSEKYFYHGTASGDLRGGVAGLHIGTYEAAKQALEATIGFRADGKDWDGKLVYGKTLLAGKKKLKEFGPYTITGYNCDVPDEDFYPTKIKYRAEFSNGELIPFTCKPKIIKVQIIGPMTNIPGNPRTDDRANMIMRRELKKGTAKKGYFYNNKAEDSGSISAVVPNGSYIRIIK